MKLHVSAMLVSATLFVFGCGTPAEEEQVVGSNSEVAATSPRGPEGRDSTSEAKAASVEAEGPNDAGVAARERVWDAARYVSRDIVFCLRLVTGTARGQLVFGGIQQGHDASNPVTRTKVITRERLLSYPAELAIRFGLSDDELAAVCVFARRLCETEDAGQAKELGTSGSARVVPSNDWWGAVNAAHGNIDSIADGIERALGLHLNAPHRLNLRDLGRPPQLQLKRPSGKLRGQ